MSKEIKKNLKRIKGLKKGQYIYRYDYDWLISKYKFESYDEETHKVHCIEYPDTDSEGKTTILDNELIFTSREELMLRELTKGYTGVNLKKMKKLIDKKLAKK